jgi:excisionase family DNA binding protein
MTLEDVSKYLDIPMKTLRKWRLDGSGPRAFKVGRHLRFRRSDVDEWLEERADEPNRPA